MTQLRPFDPQYLNKAFVGMDQLFHAFENMVDNYPPHNIIKYDNDHYAIMLAVAGFSRENIEVAIEQKMLKIKGIHAPPVSDIEYIHKGVGLRNFERIFKLHDSLEVNEVKMENGMLIIDIRRVIPDELKPRLLEIK